MSRVFDAPRERLTYTFEFEPMAGHVALETILFEALPGDKTRLTTRTVYDTVEDLEAVLQSGMEGGAVETWDRLEELLAEVQMASSGAARRDSNTVNC